MYITLLKHSPMHQYSSLVYLCWPPQTCVVHFCLETDDEENYSALLLVIRLQPPFLI